MRACRSICWNGTDTMISIMPSSIPRSHGYTAAEASPALCRVWAKEQVPLQLRLYWLNAQLLFRVALRAVILDPEVLPADVAVQIRALLRVHLFRHIPGTWLPFCPRIPNTSLWPVRKAMAGLRSL